jgi:hypothetical protein
MAEVLAKMGGVQKTMTLTRDNELARDKIEANAFRAENIGRERAPGQCIIMIWEVVASTAA